MDFDLIVFLLILLFPLFQRLFGKKQPASKKPKRAPAESAPKQIEDPLGEALRQIREALGEQTQPEQPEPEPSHFVVSEPQDEFRSLGEFEHEAHGFGRENPISEEVFEQRPAFQTRGSTTRIRQKSLGEVDLTTPLEVKTPTDAADSSRSDLARRLRDPERARDAFVLKEILDAPRSKRPIR